MKIDNEAFLKDLIGKGYFPEELPPLFSTELFSKIASKAVELQIFIIRSQSIVKHLL